MASPLAASSCDVPVAEGAELLVLPRDAFRRRLYLQPLGLLITSDGGAIESARLRLSSAAGRRVALQLRAVPSTSTHAILMLTADRNVSRRLRLRCTSCQFEELPFAGHAPGMHSIRLGSDGALLELSLLPHTL